VSWGALSDEKTELPLISHLEVVSSYCLADKLFVMFKILHTFTLFTRPFVSPYLGKQIIPYFPTLFYNYNLVT